MSTMEQALRDEIAWHEAEIDALSEYVKVCDQNRVWHGGAPRRIGEHNVRLAALTAALPAPGVEAPGDWVMVPRAATREMNEAGATAIDDTRDETSDSFQTDTLPATEASAAEVYAAMLAAAPSAPAEISQAQAQAMREALRNLLMEAGYMAGQLAHRGLPGVPGDSVDRALNAARAALAPEPPR